MKLKLNLEKLKLKRKKLTIEEINKKASYRFKKRQIKCKHEFIYILTREDEKYYKDSFLCVKCGFIIRWFETKDESRIQSKIEEMNKID